jgi:CRISPR/Cas system-associated exonuclease Cas4 (RecB family)
MDLDVMRSAGRGLVYYGECLACALQSGRPPCGYDYALLKAMFGSSEKSERANSIHVTDLTGCPRRAYYDKRDPSPEYVHEMLVRWMGSGFHAMVEPAEHDPCFQSELPLEHNGIVGRTDLFYQKDGRVVDLKFTRWMYIDKLPYGSHVLQVNVYAWMLRRQRGVEVNRLQIQYIDASGPTKCRKCRVPVRMVDGELKCPKCLSAIKGAHLGAYLIDVPVYTDEEVEKQILERKTNLEAALAMGFPPEPEPGFLCSYCAHAEKCQGVLVES